MEAIVLRPLLDGERRTVLEVFAGLSERSRRRRFLGAKPRLRESDLDWLLDVGRCGREAVVAVERNTGRPLGIARYVRDGDAPEAEVAFEVVDEWQGRGIGRLLTAELARVARAEGILRLRANVERDNRAALALVRGLGVVLVCRSEGSAVELVVRLAD